MTGPHETSNLLSFLNQILFALMQYDHCILHFRRLAWLCVLTFNLFTS